MKNENLIHIKLEYEEARQSRKDILSSERDLINLLKIIKRFHVLRKSELNLRLDIYKKLKELKLNLGKINQTLPKIKIPEIMHKEKTEEAGAKRKEEYKDRDIESQLRDIQEKLKKLE